MENNRPRQIIDALSNKDHEKLKELNITDKEVNDIINSIDRKIEKLDSEILEYISAVEKEINYEFPNEYKEYLLKTSSLKPEKNVLRLENGNEKVLRCLLSMDPNSTNYILKFQKFDSELESKLVPFALLEFGDILCFERETNKIVYYNHELDSTEIIADNWNNFINELYDN